MTAYWEMTKNFYLLLREKFNLEKKRDKLLSKLLKSILDWEMFGGGVERKRLLEEYISITEELEAIQQKLEPEFEEE